MTGRVVGGFGRSRRSGASGEGGGGGCHGSRVGLVCAKAGEDGGEGRDVVAGGEGEKFGEVSGDAEEDGVAMLAFGEVDGVIRGGEGGRSSSSSDGFGDGDPVLAGFLGGVDVPYESFEFLEEGADWLGGDMAEFADGVEAGDGGEVSDGRGED